MATSIPAKRSTCIAPMPRAEAHHARVKQISPVLDPASGTFEVLAELTGERGALRPGMTANIRIDAGPTP